MGDDEKKSDCVKVAIRLRPLSTKEKGNNEESIIEMETSDVSRGAAGLTPGAVTINDPAEKEVPGKFAFDIVFGLDCEQVQVFECVGKPALESMLVGYNSTIFAYGQTGSGKSWSMTGAGGELRGIIPRVNEELFERIAAEQESVKTRRFLVMCSFFEIYNEIIFDLLNPVQDRSKMGAGLQVKEHPVLGIYVKDLQEMTATDAEKLEQLMTSGIKNRAVSSTMMNSVSSRSHSIFTIKVHQKDEEDKSKNVFAKLNLVDLAGSERQKGTGATGQTLKEGANINKSLSALGNVINALVENANGKKVFVPFRNSKLTRVLQESLGGNSLCTMLAALSPAACNYEETLSTLRYANRAKAIKVSATKNEEASQISRLNAEIEELKKKLAAASTGGGGGQANPLMAEEERSEIKAKFQAQIADMTKMVNSTWEEKERLSKSHEAQLQKAMQEQKRQAKAMEAECKKRFRLLQEQNDLSLSIRGLQGAFQSLPSKAKEASPSGPSSDLRSGKLLQQWLKTAKAITEVTAGLKQQVTMATVFQGAFSEDLRLWADGEEATDNAMARTGARRALTKLETLRAECQKLCTLESQSVSRIQEFGSAVKQAREEWSSGGTETVMAELRTSKSGHENGANAAPGEPESAVSQVHVLALEDIGRILELIEKQIRERAEEITSLAALEVKPCAELVLRGMSMAPVQTGDCQDLALFRNIVNSEGQGEQAATAAPDSSTPGQPREQRPLHEWSSGDCDDSPEGTEFALTQLVDLDCLTKKKAANELLARPPPKFVYDVAILVRHSTGYLPTLPDDWPEPREGKVDLLQHIVDTVASTLGLPTIDFDPSDVLKGKEVPRTLRLLQLLVVAAAKESKRGEGTVQNAQASAERKQPGTMGAVEMPLLLDAVVRCLHMAMEGLEQQKEETGHGSPTRELESSYRQVQEKLEEETQVRKRQEERLAEMRKELQASQAVLNERGVQLDDAKKVAGEAESKKTQLRRQVEVLRAGLMARAQQLESSNVEVSVARQELERVAEELSVKSQIKSRLTAEVKRLQQQHIDTETERETMEAEVKRMKAKIAEDLEDEAKRAHSEQVMMLQAEKQKLDLKVASLEEELKATAEVEDGDRQREMAMLEEKNALTSKNDDVQTQLQVIIEERDALRDGMDQLWQKKTNANEELDNVTSGYTHLSDRLLEKSEEFREMEEQLQQYENLLSMLQENAEKNRNSPSLSQRASPVPQAAAMPAEVAAAPPTVAPQPMAPPLVEPPTQAPAMAPADGGDGGGSSHYSDDDFEEPDED